MFTGVTIALGLVALFSGIALLIWAMRNEGKGIGLAKIFGYIISILAFLVILFTILSGTFEAFKMKSMMKNGCPMCNMMQKNNMENKSMMDDKGKPS